jgi:hypothetical protein
MILATVTLDSNLSNCAWQGLVFLLLLAGTLLFLCWIAAENNPVASGYSRAERPKPRFAFSTEARPGLSSPALGVLPVFKRAHDRGGPKEKRDSLRRGGSTVPVLVSDAESPAEAVQGLVLNRSRGGLCLSLPRSVEVGRLLSVRTPNFPDDLESVRIRVRHTKQQGETSSAASSWRRTLRACY